MTDAVLHVAEVEELLARLPCGCRCRGRRRGIPCRSERTNLPVGSKTTIGVHRRLAAVAAVLDVDQPRRVDGHAVRLAPLDVAGSSPQSWMHSYVCSPLPTIGSFEPALSAARESWDL